MVSAGPVDSSGISIFNPGFPISNPKYKYTYKYSTPGVLMSGSSTPGIAMPGSPTPTPGIAMHMPVTILAMVLEFPSSSTTVSTSPSMVNGVGGIFIVEGILILVLKGEVFLSLLIDGSQIFHAAYHGCRHGYRTEMFAGDALPYRQAEEGVSALEVGGWDNVDSTSSSLIISII